jgi:threonine dehydrogenase-like Zn-dependent dehydrogenase
LDIINTRALIVEPKKNIYFDNITLKANNISEVKTEWYISSVCNSERRRYNLTKSHTDDNPFVGGHEAIGNIKSESYIKNRYALLPHSNCMTRNEKIKCHACLENRENLCQYMRHAGLDGGTPSGFTNEMFVPKSQLYNVSELDEQIAPFLEPLSCVVHSWRQAQFNISSVNNVINIIGGGPIGCLHALYLNKINKTNKINIIEINLQRFHTLERIFSDIENINIYNGECDMLADISVMAASNSSAYLDTVKLTKIDGKILLFSGFDDVTLTHDTFLPEIIHRNEFTYYASKLVLVGSSGYTKIDLNLAKSCLLDFDILKRLITGRVFGLSSKAINLFDGTTQIHDENILIKDIKGNFPEHIKIQYFNNHNEIDMDR